MALLGLTGKAGSGKDTVCKILQELYPEKNIQRVAFADKLKQSVAALFGVDVEVLERFKDHSLIGVIFGSLSPHAVPIVQMSVRTLLQRYGTESHREVFGSDFWVRQALSEERDYKKENVVVTDVRFQNEVDYIYKLGGIVLEITRKSVHSDDLHLSERGDLKVDGGFSNDGSIEDLRYMVDTFFTAYPIFNNL